MPGVPELDVLPKAKAPVTGRPSQSHFVLALGTAVADGLDPDPEPEGRTEAGVGGRPACVSRDDPGRGVK